MSAEGDAIDAARDAAQQLVTACLHGGRTEAVAIAQEYPDPLVLALVLGDLVAYTHTRWARSVGMDDDQRDEAWHWLLTDVEEWRLGVSS